MSVPAHLFPPRIDPPNNALITRCGHIVHDLFGRLVPLDLREDPNYGSNEKHWSEWKGARAWISFGREKDPPAVAGIGLGSPTSQIKIHYQPLELACSRTIHDRLDTISIPKAI